MIIQSGLNVLEKAINNYLQLDPHSLQRLTALSGKVVVFDVADLNLRLAVKINEQGVHLSNDYSDEVDATLKGSPLSLFKMGITGADSAFGSDVEIEGDLQLGQELKDIFDTLEIDWEEHLSHFVGDVIAHQMGNFARGLKSWGKASTNNFQNDVTEYIHEEAKWLPGREEMEDFFNEVDKLRGDVDRFKARAEKELK